MQWIRLFFSFLIGKFNRNRHQSLKEMALAIFEEALYRSRKPAALLMTGLICVLLLSGGFFMSLVDLTTQYDREGAVRMTATTASGLTLVVLAVGAFLWVFMQAWPGIKNKAKMKLARETPTAPSPSSLEQALSLLVLDFVKEREENRQQRQQASTPPPHRPRGEESAPQYNN